VEDYLNVIIFETNINKNLQKKMSRINYSNGYVEDLVNYISGVVGLLVNVFGVDSEQFHEVYLRLSKNGLDLRYHKCVVDIIKENPRNANCVDNLTFSFITRNIECPNKILNMFSISQQAYNDFLCRRDDFDKEKMRELERRIYEFDCMMNTIMGVRNGLFCVPDSRA